MLPFTKRPGRGEEAGDVVSKDDLARTGASASLPRKPMVSVSDEEMTTLMPTKALGNTGMTGAVPAPPPSRPGTVPPPRSVRPAAGMPPPSRTSGPASTRSFAQDDEEEDGRTVVRGAPRIVKRGATKAGLGQPTMPTTISPAAVIKATLESARAARGESLMAGPPAELLEDRGEVHPADEGPQRTAILAQSGGNPAHSQPPPSLQSGAHGALQSGGHPAFPVATGYPSSMGQQAMNQTFGPPMSVRPQPASNYPPAYSQPVPSASVSVPGMATSVPAHFMARTDPPATSVTSRTRASGRPATSWAMALLACGLFVGVGAVAAIQRNGPFMDTTASFVDPSHASAQRAAVAAVQVPAPVPVPVPVETPKVAAPPAVTATAAQPVAVVPATVVPVTPAAATAPAPPPPAHPTGAVIGASPVPPPVATQAPAPAPAKTESRAPVAARPAAPPPPPAAPRPAPERKVAASEEEPKKAPASKKGASSKSDNTDEETKKALEALQKAQLESSQSFGEK